MLWSLPLWECGLKYQEVSVDVTPMVSLPLRECGLKFINASVAACQSYVTPLAGVWIEIDQWQDIPQRKKLSLPLRECGLK